MSTINQTITCLQCAGTGYIEHEEKPRTVCDICDGSGVFDYELIAEYARQIEYYRKQSAERGAAIRKAVASLRAMPNLTNNDAAWEALNALAIDEVRR